jgi:hypothetical protein
MSGSALEPHNPGQGSIDKAYAQNAACILFQQLCLQAIERVRNVNESVVRFCVEESQVEIRTKFCSVRSNSQVVTLRHFPRCLGDFQTPSKMLTVVIATTRTHFQAARGMVSAMQRNPVPPASTDGIMSQIRTALL